MYGNKVSHKVIAIIILAISLAAVPMLSVSEPAYAAAKKKKAPARKAPKKEIDMGRAMEVEAKRFIKQEKIPQRVVSSGEIYIIRSYVAQFKAIQGNGAELYAEPNMKSKQIMKLPNGIKLLAEAEWVGDSGGNWYYVHTPNKAKGWVLSQYIVEREPD